MSDEAFEQCRSAIEDISKFAASRIEDIITDTVVRCGDEIYYYLQASKHDLNEKLHAMVVFSADAFVEQQPYCEIVTRLEEYVKGRIDNCDCGLMLDSQGSICKVEE